MDHFNSIVRFNCTWTIFGLSLLKRLSKRTNYTTSMTTGTHTLCLINQRYSWSYCIKGRYFHLIQLECSTNRMSNKNILISVKQSLFSILIFFFGLSNAVKKPCAVIVLVLLLLVGFLISNALIRFESTESITYEHKSVDSADSQWSQATAKIEIHVRTTNARFMLAHTHTHARTRHLY